VVQADPCVPQRVPQRVGDLPDVRMSIVDEYEVEVGERGEFTTAKAADGDQRDAGRRGACDADAGRRGGLVQPELVQIDQGGPQCRGTEPSVPTLQQPFGRLDKSPYDHRARLEGIRAAFAGADTDHGVDGGDPHLAVTDLAGVGGGGHRVDHLVDACVVGDDLDLQLGHEVDGVLGAAVDLGVALLPAVALHLADRHPQHAELFERGADVVESERLDDGGDQLHDVDSSIFLAAPATLVSTEAGRPPRPPAKS